MLTLIYFILILGVVVLIHELGHFLFAKKFGVHVYEFSIGMGPRIFKFNRKNDETDYCFRLFPIGGFVQMAGEELEVDEKIPPKKRLQSKKWYQRLLVMVAGVMNNFILAFIIFLIIGWTNTVSLNSVYVTESVIDDIPNGSKVVKVDGHKVNNYDRLALELTVKGDKEFPITIKDENGKKQDIVIKPIALGNSGMVYGYDYGFTLGVNSDGNLIITKSNNDKLSDDSIIKAVDGVEFDNYLEYLELIRDKDKSFTLTLENKDGEIKDVSVKVEKTDDDDLNGYSQGFSVTGIEQKGFLAGIKYAFGKFFSTIEQMFWTVWYLITGKISLTMLSGPVGIYSVVGEASKAGFTTILSLIALLNINVGFINILPLPAFDGGHALFLVIEKIKGSPVNPKFENLIHNIFFILLMILMVYITFNDIVRLF